MSWQCPMVVASTGQKTGMWGLGLGQCKTQPQQPISVSLWRTQSASCSQTGGLCPAVVLISAGGLWLRGMGTEMGSFGITHDSVSILF